MNYTVDFYDSKESYEKAKTNDQRNPWFVQMDFMIDPIVGNLTNLIIIPDHFNLNPWYKEIPKYLYFIAEVKHEGPDLMVQMYYTGSENGISMRPTEQN